MQIKRSLLLIALFCITAATTIHAQSSEETGKYLQLQLERYLVPFEHYDRAENAKSEIMMLKVDINKAGKVDSIRLLSDYIDTTFKKALVRYLDKFHESFAFPGAKAGIYPVLFAVLYGDSFDRTFNYLSIRGAIKLIHEKYRSFENDPLLVIVHVLPMMVDKSR